MAPVAGLSALARAAASKANYDKQVSKARLQRVVNVLRNNSGALYDAEQQMIEAGNLEPMHIVTPKKADPKKKQDKPLMLKNDAHGEGEDGHDTTPIDSDYEDDDDKDFTRNVTQWSKTGWKTLAPPLREKVPPSLHMGQPQDLSGEARFPRQEP